MSHRLQTFESLHIKHKLTRLVWITITTDKIQYFIVFTKNFIQFIK